MAWFRGAGLQQNWVDFSGCGRMEVDLCSEAKADESGYRRMNWAGGRRCTQADPDVSGRARAYTIDCRRF